MSAMAVTLYQLENFMLVSGEASHIDDIIKKEDSSDESKNLGGKDIIELLPEDPFDMGIRPNEVELVQVKEKGHDFVAREAMMEKKVAAAALAKMNADEGCCLLGCKATGLIMCFGCDKYSTSG